MAKPTPSQFFMKAERAKLDCVFIVGVRIKWEK
jgi:hypothetical protein